VRAEQAAIEHRAKVGIVGDVESKIESLRVLVVDDSETDAKLVVKALRRDGRSVYFERVETADAMRRALATSTWDVILCDWSMPAFSAHAALGVVKKLDLDLPFIIVSGTMGEETAVEAMRAGAHDYVLKGRLSRLTPAVEREIREFQRREAHRQSERRLKQSEEALRESEGHLRQAQKMEAVGRLAGGVAHDFNNVLSVILTYGDLMLSSLPPDDPNREDVEEIRRAGLRAAGLTRQLLMFSRQHVVEPKVVDVNDVIDGMQKMLSRLLGEDVELVVLKHATAWKTRVDPSSFDQVIMNLVVNARDAMPTGGKLTIKTDNVSVDDHHFPAHFQARGGDYVVVTVTDDGTGMDKETIARIFDPFFTTKEKGKGTGLGLSTVFGILQQCGGAICVHSEPGHGSTFEVYFPRVEGAVVTRRPPRDPAQRRGSETILLVEDEEAVRTVIQTVLLRQGYTVVTASDGQAGLDVSQKCGGPIHLLLTDVVMPRMSGPALARQLAARRPETRVLYISGYTDDSAMRHGVADGELAYLQKPITPGVLIARVREILDAPPTGRAASLS
jgi:two-component system cell cycle sensor histidine kinase/response regulator CckA